MDTNCRYFLIDDLDNAASTLVTKHAQPNPDQASPTQLEEGCKEARKEGRTIRMEHTCLVGELDAGMVTSMLCQVNARKYDNVMVLVTSSNVMFLTSRTSPPPSSREPNACQKTSLHAEAIITNALPQR